MWNSINFMNNAELRDVMDSNKLDAKWQAGQHYWHGSNLTLVPFFWPVVKVFQRQTQCWTAICSVSTNLALWVRI